MTGDLFYIHETKELTQVDFLEKKRTSPSQKILRFLLHIHYILLHIDIITKLMLYLLMSFI